MTEEAQDLNAALAAAWDAAEAEDGDETEVHESAAAETESGDTGQPAGDEAEVQPEGELDGVQPGGDRPEESAASDDESSLDTPPKGLSLEAREAWKETPEAVRKEIAKREADFERGIVKYAQNAKRAEAMDQVLAPYQQLFALNGGPGNTLPGLLQTAALLQMGSPQQKAETAANLIKQFGVDIRALDSALVGAKPPAEVQQTSQLEQLLNQKLQPLQQQLQTYQQREQQMQEQEQQAIQQEIQKFAVAHEFYDDVKEEMADLLDMSAKRGRAMTLEEAYNIACSTHPSISKIMTGRQAKEATANRQRAASSVRGSVGGVLDAPPDSRMAALNDAWDNAGRM
jgi:hypothetical protein